jgi:hypothetical protein
MSILPICPKVIPRTIGGVAIRHRGLDAGDEGRIHVIAGLRLRWHDCHVPAQGLPLSLGVRKEASVTPPVAALAVAQTAASATNAADPTAAIRACRFNPS